MKTVKIKITWFFEGRFVELVIEKGRLDRDEIGIYVFDIENEKQTYINNYSTIKVIPLQ